MLKSNQRRSDLQAIDDPPVRALPALVTTEAVGQGIDDRLGRALSAVRTIDTAAPEEGLQACYRLGDVTYLLDLGASDPLGWQYSGAFGVENLRGASIAGTAFVGDHVDQGFVQKVLIPSYVQVIEVNQPVVHRVSGICNDTFLSYRRLTVPLYAGRHHERASHLATFTILEMAIPGIGATKQSLARLTARERQCLSLAAAGQGQKRAAAALGVSEKMIELHLAHARKKLGARTTTQAVAIFMATAWAQSLKACPQRDRGGRPQRQCGGGPGGPPVAR